MPTSTVHAFTDELARLDAVATAEAIRSGELSATEVVAAAVARAERIESSINAIVTPDFERAVRTAAKTAPGAFAGVPTFIKDLIDVEGLPTRHGSEALDGVGAAQHTEGLAQQMFDMGMVCLGKSTLPEFGFPPSTEFPHAEPTRNPWNLAHTAGGSSGGSAALVAAGVVPVAHGADGGGSIRIPAACCGLVGLKPTRGRLLTPSAAKLLPVNIVVDGVLSRSVRDTTLYYNEAEKRFRNHRLPPMGRITTHPERRLRFGAVIKSPVGEVDAPTRATFDKTVTLLEELGHHVELIAAPASAQFAEDFIHLYALLAFVVRTAGRRLFDRSFDRSRLTQLTHGLAARFQKRITSTPGAIFRLRRSAAELAPVFERFDVVLSPTVNRIAPEVGYLGMDLPFDVVFPRIVEWAGFTPLANASGSPSISLPLGHDVDMNLPIGMMFTAAPGQDGLLLQLALELEDAAPWRTLATTETPRSQ